MKRYRAAEQLHKRNGGFSLVELVIVIAIMAVLIGTVVLSVSMVFSANAKTCSASIQRAIADCKVTTMGKAGAYLVIYRESDGQLYSRLHVMEQKEGEVAGTYEDTPSDPEKLGGKRVSLTYTDASGVDRGEVPVGEANGIRIEFDRSSGSFKTDCPKTIDVQGGNRHYRMTFITLTGKLKVEQVS